MKSTLKRLRRKQRLWDEQAGKCHWCGNDMLHWADCPQTRTGERPLPDNLATIEHLRDRFDPKRRITARDGERRWALAHYKCNQERARAREAALGREELRRRSLRPRRRLAA